MKAFLKKIIIASILLVVVILSGLLIEYYFTPFMYIIVLYLFSIWIYKILKKLFKNKKICGGLTLVFINIIIFFVIFYLGSEIYNIIQKLLDGSIKDIQIINKITSSIFNGTEKVGTINAKSLLMDNGAIKKGVKLTSDGLVSYIFSNIFVYFLLTDIDNIKCSLKKIIPIKIWESISKTLKKSKNMALIEGSLVLVTTLQFLIGFLVLRIPKSIFLAILCGILDILPYVGTIIVFIPLIIYNIVLKEYFIAIGLVLVYILAQIIREVLETKYVGDNLELHPLVVLLSIYLGAKFLGIIGFILGPVYVLLLKEINFNAT